MPQFTAQQISQHVGGTLVGSASLALLRVESMDRSGAGDLTLITDDRYVRLWPEAQASGALVQQGLKVEPGDGRALIFVPDASLAMLRALELFAPPLPSPPVGVDPRAAVDPTAKIAPDARVGPHCVVGPRVTLGHGAVLYANVVVLDDSAIGDRTVLWPGVVVRERCRVGRDCILHPNVTLGADGFGFLPAAKHQPSSNGQGWLKIPQIGTVRIGDHVEIGAGTCVDRGKYSETFIDDGTKIDNLCQIAHNCTIGKNCILAGQVGLAGSVTLGDGVIMGGKVAVKDQVTIGAGVRLAACSAVMEDIPANQTWGGYPARDARIALREHAAMRKLPDLIQSLQADERAKKKRAAEKPA